MPRPTRLIATLSIVLAVALLGGCAWPTYNPWKLRAIKGEADALMATYPIRPPDESIEVPASKWPRTIASLEPYAVAVYPWGVDIWQKPYLDGGWGYHIPKAKRDLPRPSNSYSELSDGVFWHGPL